MAPTMTGEMNPGRTVMRLVIPRIMPEKSKEVP